MLNIGRKLGESVIINDNIQVTVLEVKGKTVKLGFDFSADVQVHREEVYRRIQDENRAAAASTKIFEI